MSAEQIEIKIQRVLRTESGNILVILGGDAEKKRLFTAALKPAIRGVAGKLKTLVAKEIEDRGS